MKRDGQDDLFGQESPGRIPESLIDAALDGEICDRMQDEIAHALRYDHHRRAELLETADAVRALDINEIPMPDLRCAVLNRLDQHERFIPRSMRRWVRTGRMAVAAGVLLGLMLVAGLQSVYPRLTTLGAQSTPVHDVASAVVQDTQCVAEDVQQQVRQLRASVAPFEGLLAAGTPSASERSLALTINNRVIRLSNADLSALRECGVGGQSVHAYGSGDLAVVQWSGRDQITGVGMSLVSYSGPEYSDVGGGVGGNVGGGYLVIRSSNTERTRVRRVERESLRDERIADLP